MSLTENLKPGPDADRKSTVGENIPELQWTTIELPSEVLDRAIRNVASRAVDNEDARMLLDVLGLVEPAASGGVS
ncbi:hypothetical protein Caci_3034 [Catenulispora acidiphila DSM 44928]|uniref:Uncharacterized protein n=1 Tax=Catenulispora acidiphila (strain DSM 44928 / JCM 14897 / NBRC 102108 / NRRL B-24433 / ID139908) TaxID=479433 RepID=C7Q4H4_CATAD|nr:hypothetical protein [Catenulispora acidiphila]ACU71943.1 hypothetical protein Caci_3034 [Catenulispora acidiphila DSM 44928]